MVLIFLQRLLAVSVLIASAWCLHVYGVGHVLSERFMAQGAELANIKVPEYLSADALGMIAERGNAEGLSAESLSKRALSQDPSNGRAAAFLMSIFNAEGRKEDAADAAGLAGRLWPSNTYTHSRLADYWFAQNRMDKFIHELGLLMVREPALRKTFYPVVEELAVSSGGLDLLNEFIQEPPNWWPGFFSLISKNQSLAVLNEIFERREKSSSEIGEYERKIYVSRLLKEKQVDAAFSLWQAGLSADQERLLINGLYDGGFEGDGFDYQFGWSVGRNKSFDIKAQTTYGVSGRKALRILFKQGGKRIRFNHLSQRVVLAPGAYKLKFRSRLDTLKTTKGLVWRVRCISDGNKVLGESSALKGRDIWKAYELEFSVPSSCKAQSVRLEAVSRFAHDHLFSGQVWFDDLAIIGQQEK